MLKRDTGQLQEGGWASRGSWRVARYGLLMRGFRHKRGIKMVATLWMKLGQELEVSVGKVSDPLWGRAVPTKSS